MRDLVSNLQHRNMYGVLKYTAQLYNESPVVTDCIEDSNTLIDHSYRELLEDVEKLAAGLQHYMKERTHFALCANNSYNWIISFLAIVCSGNVVIPLDANMTENELDGALRAVDAQVLITDKSYSHVLVQKYTLLNFVNIGRSVKCEFQDFDEKNIPSIFLMTSGVTSSPKFVMLSQKNLIYSTLNGVDAVPLKPGKKVLSILPLHHSYELSCGMLYHICCGSHIYINDKKSNFIKNLRIIEPHCLVAVPSVVYSLLSLLKAEKALWGNSYVEKIEIIYCGGASVDSNVVKEFQDNGIWILQGYGMTECGPAITFNRIEDFTVDTVGKALRFVQIRIDNNQIYVKAPNVMIGYYKNPQATTEVLQNGWLKTGDAGYFDDENHLILCGRVKNIIVLNTGENIYPEELEERIYQFDRTIKYCKVYEEDGLVAVDLYSSVHTEQKLIEMITSINDQISDFKKIEIVHVLENMPAVTALGKAYRWKKDGIQR